MIHQIIEAIIQQTEDKVAMRDEEMTSFFVRKTEVDWMLTL